MTRRSVIRFAAVVTAALVVVAVAVAGVLAVTYVRRPFPQHDGTVDLVGFSAPVNVVRDDQGVPQIYADTSADLFRAQGYVHAQDRFLEMDLRRHITAGRLAELVGDNGDAVQTDTVIRTLGWRRVAEQELPRLAPETRAALEAYSAGVNDYLRGKSPSEISVTYTLLGINLPEQRIEPWTPLDSLTWLKAVAWDLRANYADELARARALQNLRDPRRVDQLFPAYPADHEPIVTSGSGSVPQASTSSTTTAGSGASPTSRPADSAPAAAPNAEYLTAMRQDTAQQAFQTASDAMTAVPAMLGQGSGVGSNSWVVSGDLTETGKPLLANDPHLTTQAPGVWVQGGLHCRAVGEACPYDVAGYTFAGLPGIVIGHNGKISWGLTNLGADVTDFYLEKITGDTVLRDGRQEPVQTRTEVIEVAGGEPVTVTVRATSHGPIVSDVIGTVREAGVTAPVAENAPGRGQAYAVSLAWTALTPGRSMDAVLAIDQAQDFAEFRAGAELLDAPSQNLVYADTDGHIAYQAPGRIPVRDAVPADGSPVPADGSWPQPGWISANDWDGYLPFASLPSVQDPAEGFIVAANQAVTAAGTGPRLTSDFDYGYRSDRIRTLIEQAVKDNRKLTVDDMSRFQNDTANGIAPLLVPMMLKTDVDAFTKEAVDLLEGWDYTQPTDSAAAAYFNVVWTTLLDSAFGDQLPDGFRPDGGDRWMAVVENLLADSNDPFWDDNGTPDVVETRDEVLRRSLVQARLTLTSTLGKDASRWEWGRLHTLTLEQQPLGGEGVPGLVHRLVNLGPYAAPGGSSIVNAMAWDASSGNYHVVAGPSMRMIVDLADLDRSRWVNQTGSSGHPGDSHYGDQVEHWLKGETYAWPFTKAAVDEAENDTLTLRPPPSGS